MGKVSFEDIGGVVATFAAQEGMSDACQVVKITGNGQVGPCAAGEAFCGMALAGTNQFAAVQVGGFAEVKATGEISLGWVKLSADGNGGIKKDTAGREYLVVNYDSAAGTAVVYL